MEEHDGELKRVEDCVETDGESGGGRRGRKNTPEEFGEVKKAGGSTWKGWDVFRHITYYS